MVPHDSQHMLRICWACDPNAPTTRRPVLHLISRYHTHLAAHPPPQAYAWLAAWFRNADTNLTVVSNPDHKFQWLFTTTPTWPRPDPAGIAIRYSMHEPGRAGTQEHRNYPLHHSCHTPQHLTQTLTCRDLNPDTANTLHYIYSYLTQGQPEQGLIAMSPRTNRGVHHPHPAVQNAGGPPHHRPRHIRLPAHEPMPPPTIELTKM